MPFDPGFDAFVSADTAKAVYDKAHVGTKKAGFWLLWGDGVRIVQQDGLISQVKARGQTGWIETAHLQGQSLLEVYFIDVGQGDGLLIKTPDFRHIMLDGGYPRKSQPAGKSAADFVDWKFNKDYGSNAIVLDAMISSHIDFDHYGGLDDLIDVAQIAELDCQSISIEAFYHSGLSHWAAHGSVGQGLGPHVTAGGAKWFTRLLSDRQSATDATQNVGPQLRGRWGDFVTKIVAAKKANGTPTHIERLSQTTQWLPDFGQGSSLPIRVLGPIAGQSGGAPTLLRLDSSQSINTNGCSVLLRLDFDHTRILLTGDLNAKAHQSLLQHYAGAERETFACDVAKCCHHGSEDVSFTFLQFMQPACTVISSGDDEGHDHPRPRVVAAAGLTGFREIKDDRVVTPLVYSTELARSIELGHPDRVVAGNTSFGTGQLGQVKVEYRVTNAGALSASREEKTMNRTKLMHKLLYGLVNIRTDGKRILSATMNEGDRSFAVKTFQSRF